ncbi:MAG TPA: hypothetical protein VIJ16_10090 [Gemmatimonadaceae bacterium]
MTTPTILVATWRDGLFAFTGETAHQELAGQAVGALSSDGHGRALAIVDGHSLCLRAHNGAWSTIATSESQLSSSGVVGDTIYVGTDDARILRVSPTGAMDQLDGFDAVPGRDTWYAGSALIDGQLVGPPLGIRSITATSNGVVLLVNVHVGGVPRSTDGGMTWQPTIEVASDVHEVVAHPIDPDIVIAAAAIGLCISRDGGATWTLEREGLHALHCSAVAFWGNDILVSAAAHHFATEGAVYRRSIDGHGSLVPVGAGLPRWIDGIVDTRCIGTHASTGAVADRGGNLYVSVNAGGTWSRRTTGLSAPSSVLIV